MELYYLFGGAVLGVILARGFSAAQSAYHRRRLKRVFSEAPTIIKKAIPTGAREASASPGSESTKVERRKTEEKSITRIEKAEMRERERKLAEMLAEMRELVLRLTEIVASTNNISGEVSERFEQAQKALESLELDSDVNLGQVRSVILGEIHKMVRSNEALKKQLVVAESGITTQQLEIDRLRTKANIDALTQLFNRSFFDDFLKEIFVKWRTTKEVFSLLFLDIDHFKRVNDTHGHLHGDRLLKEISAKIKSCIRDHDLAARYGGEEFAVVFPDTPAEEALAVGTRIRETIEQTHFQVDANPIRITISGGIAQSGICQSPEDIIDMADKALYRSKNRGRNRITLGEDNIKESWTSGDGKLDVPTVPDVPENPEAPGIVTP